MLPAAWSLLFVAAAAHAALMFREGHWLEQPVAAGRLAFCAASLIVYAAAAWRLRRPGRRPDFVGALLIVALCAWVLGDALFISKGDQRGLVFLFLPPLQWLVLGVCAAVSAARRSPC